MTVEKEEVICDGGDEDREFERSKSTYTSRCSYARTCNRPTQHTEQKASQSLTFLSFDPSFADRLQVLRTPLDPHLWLWHDFHLDDSLLFTQAGQDLRLDTLEFRFRAVDLVDVRVLQFTDLSDVRDADWQRAGL